MSLHFNKTLYQPEKKHQINPDIKYYMRQAYQITQKFGGNIKGVILNNRNLIGDIANALMLADWRYDENRQIKSSQSTYRVYCGKCMIKHIRQRLAIEQSRCVNFSHFNGVVSDNLDYLPDKKNKVDIHEQIEHYLNQLTNDLDEQIVRLYYLEDLTLNQVADRLGYSREMVRKRLNQAMLTLRQFAESET